MGQEPEINWFPPITILPDFIWSFSPKGWTDKELGIDWLKEILIPLITQSDEHYILLLDGHDSHESGEFQWQCIQNRIHTVYLPPHTSHKLQPLDVGPFSSLASHYGKAVHKYTPTGYATIDRATFTTLYAEIRPKAMNERNIRAGWKRAGIQPWDKARILSDPEVINFGRITPEIIPPPSKLSPRGLPITPKKLQEFESITDRICDHVSPLTEVAVRKLYRATVHEFTANQVLQNDLKEVRKHAVDTEISKRSKRLKKQADKRSWNLQEVREAREGLRRVKIYGRRVKPFKRLKLNIPISDISTFRSIVEKSKRK